MHMFRKWVVNNKHLYKGFQGFLLILRRKNGGISSKIQRSFILLNLRGPWTGPQHGPKALFSSLSHWSIDGSGSLVFLPHWWPWGSCDPISQQLVFFKWKVLRKYYVTEPSPLCAIYFFIYPSTKGKHYLSLKCSSHLITVLHGVLHKEKML